MASEERDLVGNASTNVFILLCSLVLEFCVCPQLVHASMTGTHMQDACQARSPARKGALGKAKSYLWRQRSRYLDAESYRGRFSSFTGALNFGLTYWLQAFAKPEFAPIARLEFQPQLT